MDELDEKLSLYGLILELEDFLEIKHNPRILKEVWDVMNDYFCELERMRDEEAYSYLYTEDSEDIDENEPEVINNKVLEDIEEHKYIDEAEKQRQIEESFREQDRIYNNLPTEPNQIENNTSQSPQQKKWIILEIKRILVMGFGYCAIVVANPLDELFLTNGTLVSSSFTPCVDSDTIYFLIPEQSSYLRTIPYFAQNQIPWEPELKDFSSDMVRDHLTDKVISCYKHRSFDEIRGKKFTSNLVSENKNTSLSSNPNRNLPTQSSFIDDLPF